MPTGICTHMLNVRNTGYIVNMNLTKVKNSSYWERVEIMKTTLSQDEISYIQENESEDNFKIALAGRVDATPEQLAWCADTSSHLAQKLVLARANVGDETIVLIGLNAVDEYKTNIAHASYVHPMKSYHETMVANAIELFRTATILLERRKVAWLSAGDAMAMLTDNYAQTVKAEQHAMAIVRDFIDDVIDRKKPVSAWVSSFNAVMENTSVMRLAMLRHELATLVSAYAFMVMEELALANKPSLADACLKKYEPTTMGVTMPIKKFW